MSRYPPYPRIPPSVTVSRHAIVNKGLITRARISFRALSLSAAFRAFSDSRRISHCAYDLGEWQEGDVRSPRFFLPAPSSSPRSERDMRERPEPYPSSLVERPDHLAALGLLSVEISNLEHACAHLFTALLGISFGLAHTIYFTPRVAMGRLDLISNIAPLTLEKFPTLKTRTLNIVRRSKAAMGKRHSLVHDSYGVEGREIVRLHTPRLEPPTTLTLQELLRFSVEIQQLSADTQALAWEIDNDSAYVSFLRKWHARWLSHSHKAPPKPKRATRQSPPRSSQT